LAVRHGDTPFIPKEATLITKADLIAAPDRA
jgi:hypothetical protein